MKFFIEAGYIIGHSVEVIDQIVETRKKSFPVCEERHLPDPPSD